MKIRAEIIEIISYRFNINHMAMWNLFDVVNSVILKFPAVAFSF